MKPPDVTRNAEQYSGVEGVQPGGADRAVEGDVGEGELMILAKRGEEAGAPVVSDVEDKITLRPDDDLDKAITFYVDDAEGQAKDNPDDAPARRREVRGRVVR